MQKMNDNSSTRGSVNRTVVLVLILIGLMLFIIGIPAMKAFRYRAERIGCEQAMKSAGDGLIIEYMDSFEQGSIQDARDTLEEVMPAREDLCPVHGNIYLIRDKNGIFEPVCGLHDPDVRRRTRLNASYALQKLEDKRKKTVPDGKNDPETLEITVNGRKLVCTHVTVEEMIHRGTKTTNGYDGVVCYYGTAGDFTFSAKTARKGMGTAKNGEVCYFVYADENYCAIWRSNDGWDGDAYQ